MPCYQAVTVSVEFKAKHLNVLADALTALKLPYQQVGNTIVVDNVIRINTDTQQATFDSEYQGTVNQIKRMYSLKAIQYAGAAKGWAVQVNPTNLQKLSITKM
jgi:hypothetical protein